MTRQVVKLPAPDIYEKEYSFWPWGELIESVARLVASHASPHARIVDYMCGTGYLLNRISEIRDDLSLEGCDIDPRYVAYGTRRYPSIFLHHADALRFVPERTPEIAICTAGIHHLARPEQRDFVAKVSSELPANGWFVVGEELIEEWGSERERRRAIVELTSALLKHAIERDSPGNILEAATDVLANDLLERGEYKLSEKRLNTLLCSHFEVIEVHRLWRATSSGGGDALFICQPQSS